MNRVNTRFGTASLALAGLTLMTVAPGARAQQAFKPGDIVVSRMGDGSAALSSAATAVFLDEYTPTGTLVQSIALPTAASGGNAALTDSGSATSDGFLTLSTNKQLLTIQGYNVALRTASVVNTTPSTTANQRVVATIDSTGKVNTTTALSDAYSGNNIRSTATTDGTTIYTSGTATSNGGVRYVAGVGSTTSTQVENTVTNVRNVNIFGGNVYFSTGSGSVGIYEVSGGLATTGPQTTTEVAIDGGTAPSPYDFYITPDGNTLFVADDRTNASGGLYKYTLSGTTFTQVGTTPFNLAAISGTGTAGLRGLTGSGSFLYATSTDNQLVSFNTTTNTFTSLATAATNEAFRGVDFAPVAAPAATPEPSSVAALAVGTGVLALLVARRRKASSAA